MTVLKKAILSFFLSVFLFSCIFAIAFNSFFDIIENRFFNPSVRAVVVRETVKDVGIIDGFISTLQNRFLAILQDSDVLHGFLSGLNNADTMELTESIPGLNSVRFIDSNDALANFSFNEIYIPVHEQFKLIFHEENDELIFSFPFVDNSNSHLGFVLFSVSARVFIDVLASAARMSYADKLIFCPAVSGGGITGIIKAYPGMPEKEILAEASKAWSGRFQSISSFASSGDSFVFVSVVSDYGFFFSRIVKEDILIFPKQLSAITLVSIFLTLFLIVFFIFNLKQFNGKKTQSNEKKIRSAENEEIPCLEELEKIDEPEISESSGIIYEQNGIPYINNSAFDHSKNKNVKLNDDFAELIDSISEKPK